MLRLFRPYISTYQVFFFCFIFCLFGACRENPPVSNNLSLQLRYYYQNPISDQASIKTGLKWVLSYLGAKLAPNQLEKAINWDAGANTLALDLSNVGFSKQAEAALRTIVQTIKSSTTYKDQSSIDLGRFVMLTLNSSYHYYAITGVYPTYADFQAAYPLEDSALIVLENGESSISAGNRIIFRTKDSLAPFTQKAFVAKEGSGSVQQGTFQATDFEVFDFLDNGQPRFAIYDAFGNLKTAVPFTMGIAGKPAKCMWCHESKIQPNFASSGPKIQSFNSFVNQEQNQLDSIRTTFVADLDYTKIQEHQLAELLYITFMEPNAERLASEWGYSLSETHTLLQLFSTHVHPEYPLLGTLYDRSDIDHLGPYQELQVPESARDISTYEPKF